MAFAAKRDLARLIRWSHNWLIVSESEDWIDSPALIVASWIHASRVHEALAEKLAVQDAQAFCERDRPELAFWGFEAELARPSDVAHPYSVTRTRLLVLGVANLLAEVRLPEEVRVQLEALLLPICYPRGLQEPPAFDLLTQRTTLKNGLDSFLGSCKSDALAAAIGGESAHYFSDAIITGNITEILERIDADASATEPWLSLVPFLVGAPPSDDQGARLAKAFAKLQPTELTFRDVNELFLIGALLFDQVFYIRSRTESSSWQRLFVAFAKKASDLQKSVLDSATVMYLATWTYYLALAFGPPADAAARMGKLLVMLAEVWPATAGPLSTRYIRFVLQQESLSGEPFWPHVLNLRCIAHQIHPAGV